MKKIVFSLVTLVLIACSETNNDGNAIQENLEEIDQTITFESNIMAINQKHCASCHGGSRPDAGLLLTTFEEVSGAYKNGRAISRIQDGTMPPSNKPRLTPEEIQLILKWEEDGFLEKE